jgi:hypothetical protein
MVEGEEEEKDGTGQWGMAFAICININLIKLTVLGNCHYKLEC